MQGLRWRNGAGRSSWLFLLSDGAGIYWKQALGHLVTVTVSFVLNRPHEGVLLSGSLSVLIRAGGKEEEEEEEEEGRAVAPKVGGLVVFKDSSGPLNPGY